MERMTEEVQELTKKMYTIADDTREETVSMRIMALIALLFLPVTFASVCLHWKRFATKRLC